MARNSVKITIANPHGFCAGVERAIEIVNQVVNQYPPPIYVRNQVVHNRFVVDSLKKKGVIFVENLDEVPNGSVTIFSAHGVSQKVRNEAKKRKLKVFDATCPLVTKVHVEVDKLAKKGKKVIMIGHKGHPEVEGTIGQLSKNKISLIQTANDIKKIPIKSNDEFGYVTQTTLSQDDTKLIINELTKRLPSITPPKKSDICYATQNRQDAIKAIAKNCDLILIIGSKNSSNSNRLREVARKNQCEAYLIDSAKELDLNWLKGKKNIGISAGASAPEILVDELIKYIKSHLTSKNIKVKIEQDNTLIEDVRFPLPAELYQKDHLTKH